MKTNFKNISLLMTAALSGFIGWSGIPWLLPVGLVILPVWYNAKSRWIAFLSVFVYLAVASRYVPVGSINFSGAAPAREYLLWLGAVLFPSSLYLLFYSKRKIFRLFGLFLALILSALPPFGLTCWTHPLLSLGAWFPGGGWVAVFSLFFMVPLFCIYPQTVIIPIFLGLLLNAPPKVSQNWVAENTNFTGKPSVSYQPPTLDEITDGITNQLAIIKQINFKKISSKNILLPESSGGLYGYKSTLDLWRENMQGNNTVFLNATIVDGQKNKDSAIVAISNSDSKIVYHQRQPVPVSMWHPLREYSYKSHWFKNPVVEYNQERIAFLICYEQFMVWTAFHSMLNRPDIICAVSNTWWAENGNIPAVQKSITYSWAKLFSLPLVVAQNT